MLCNFENEATDFIHTWPTLSRQLRNKSEPLRVVLILLKDWAFTPMCRCAYLGYWGSLWRALDIWLANIKVLLFVKPSFFSTFLFEVGKIPPLQKDFIRIMSYPNSIFGLSKYISMYMVRAPAKMFSKKKGAFWLNRRFYVKFSIFFHKCVLVFHVSIKSSNCIA